jgi:hypothetical protein
VLRIAPRLALLATLVAPAFAVAQPEVIRFRMTPDEGNGGECAELDPGLRGLHTVTLQGGIAMISSVGGLQGRLTKDNAGAYVMTFELVGRRLDGAVLVDGPPRLVVTERGRRCRWAALGQ